MLSAAGISEEGLFNAHLLLAETEQAMLRAAGRVIVVADSSKFGRKSLTFVSGLDTIDQLVCDDALPASWREIVTAAGVELLIAPLPRASEGAPSGSRPIPSAEDASA